MGDRGIGVPPNSFGEGSWQSDLPGMAPLTAWPPAPAVLKLPAREVHVWQAGLDVGTGLLAQFESILAADERAIRGLKVGERK